MNRLPLIALCLATLAGATSPPDPDFAPIGGSYGQTMRINISSYAPPCRVAAGFRTGESAPPEPDRTFDLSSGQTAFYDLNLNRLAGRFGVRVEVTPRVVILAGQCSASVEVFEQFTGRTTAHMTLFTGNSTNPPPEPEFAPLGAAPGQFVRFGIARGEGFNAIPPPCRGTLAFFDVQGALVGTTRAFDLAPGERAFLEVDVSKLSSPAVAAALRVTLWPRIMVPPPSDNTVPSINPIAGCLASVQVFESSTGWSTEATSGR